MTGEELQNLRYEMQVTQRELGDMLGKGKDTIAQYEQGRMNVPLTVEYLMTRVHKEWMDGREERAKARIDANVKAAQDEFRAKHPEAFADE